MQKIILVDIPNDPAAPRFRLGKSLGPGHAHWRRAKFNERFRLFFRFRSDARIIVYAWLNDERTLRSRGSTTDAYAVFSSRLRAGNPPDSWSDLIDEARSP